MVFHGGVDGEDESTGICRKIVCDRVRCNIPTSLLE